MPLRPLGLGELYDGAFQAIRRNPRTMLLTTAVLLALTSLVAAVPQALALRGLSPLLASTEEPALDEVVGGLAALVSSFLLPGLLQAVALLVLSGMLVVAVSRAVLGEATTPAAVWQAVRPRLLALVGVSLLVPLVVGAVVVAFAALPVGAGLLVAATGGDGGAVVLLVLAVAVAVLGSVAVGGYLATRWSMAPPVLLLERAGAAAALRRSWRLVGRARAGTFWRVLGVLLLTSVLVSVVVGVLGVPFSLLSGLVAFGQDPADPYGDLGLTLAQLLIGAVGTIVSGTLAYPFSAGVTALLYVDLRMRQEGLDVELARASGLRG